MINTSEEISEKKANDLINDLKKTTQDSLQCLKELRNLITSLQTEGYIISSVDSVFFTTDTCFATLYVGQPYQWAFLKKGNTDDTFLKGTGFREKSFTGNLFSLKEITFVREKILQNCENNGYPFAELKLDNLTISDSSLSAVLNLTKNNFVKIDSLVLRNKKTIAPIFLYNYLGIKPGDPYNEFLIQRIDKRMKELSFVREISPARVLFTDQYTKLELNLESKSASQLDGMIGLLPKTNEPGKYTLTGEAHIKLQNSFKRGEIIDFNWRALAAQTQDLKARFYYPFLFNTPFGTDLFLSVYKKDTSFITINRLLGIQYQVTGNNFLKVFVDITESNLLSTEGFENLTTLPPYADVHQRSYGLTLHFENLDYRFNPRKGFSFESSAAIGNRDIQENSDVNPALYDSLELQSSQYRIVGYADYYISLAQRHVLNTGISGGYLSSDEAFDNELFRIGGLKSLRGFNDESIFASSYLIGKLEYRYLLDLNSYLFTFYNMAWYEKNTNTTFATDTPSGFGAGLAFETKLGIMSFSYALGKEFNNPIQFKTAKIHFGIVNYF